MKREIFKASPLVLTVVGVLVFGSISVWKAMTLGLSIGGIVFSSTILLYVLWMAWESKISVGELEKTAEHEDKFTMEFAAAAKMTLIFTALLFTIEPSTRFAPVGLTLMLSGMAMRTRAIATLGSRYSHRIRKPSLPLEQSGVYGYIRHPAYFGTLVVHIGFVLVLYNTWSVLALVALWLPAVVVRTLVEEKYLKTIPEYLVYASNVKARFIPYIW